MNTQSSTFCVMPWIHQNLSLPNNYKPCCNADGEYKNITAQTTSVLDAFHSNEASTLRQQLDNNENPKICNVCWNKESMGVESYRQIYNKQYRSSLSNKPVLKYIDIEFDNVCNLQCRMCSQHHYLVIYMVKQIILIIKKRKKITLKKYYIILISLK